ncbi:MAG: aminotransferase class I/II-fold pyridoxal phosphate-dependent enzyme [Chitinophagaceae bacterium]|nr:aminotransferase class I/II-fold pyridoxal phosphate-dependent enzyme [Chitinophagaceae bacterium]MCW5905957.1 aminotransferase class I/II-fold pyridoxal phosphate-dependent enzyme [Chitinophagaceae bacterium]
MIDFRSDTVTKPSQAMLEAMIQAPVGDDVFGEDPTINALENYAANMFGMEAGLYCSSGTMTNQIAIKAHTQPGDEIICDVMSHIYQYEGGGIGFNSSCSVKLINGNRGRMTASQVAESINNIHDVHKPISKLVSLENTANRGGGSCYNFDDIKAIQQVCTNNQLLFHLDGARLFNAIVANNERTEQYGKAFDSISICLSKGLGAPVGSVLLGNKSFIQKARRIRKVFGGGMRQAGIIAAAGLYALQNNIDRLAQDHHHAQLITQALQQKDFIGEILPVETNIIIFEVKGKYTAQQFVEKLKEENILAIAISPSQVRIVVHLDITENMVQKTIDVIKSF